MEWTVTFTQDTEKPGVGTVTAAKGSFSHSGRVDTSDEGDVSRFIEEVRKRFSDVRELEVKQDSVTEMIRLKLEG